MPSKATMDVVATVSLDMLSHWQDCVREPLTSWLGIFCLAKRLGCEFDYTKGESSYEAHEFQEGPAGTARISTGGGDMVMIRSGIHELGHHTLYWWKEYRWPQPWFFAYLEQKQNTGEDLEEMVCKYMEDLVLPLPRGIQANGKPAIPDLPTVARFYQRKPIPTFFAMAAAEIEAMDTREKAQQTESSLFLPESANLNSPNRR